jgi:hypothetical protein
VEEKEEEEEGSIEDDWRGAIQGIVLKSGTENELGL